MKLSQLFTGRPRTEERVGRNGRTSQPQSAARMADLNRQIRSLAPGQTIRGEIVSRNGSEVQIRLSDDMVMNARVDQSINLELGKSVTFEVKSNGGTLSLSPLFTNIAADANVLKALDMAGLPVNDISVSMTEQMMKAGLSVNRNSLQQVYREINGFPGSEVSDVVDLHRLQLPVNEENVRQMESYRNLTHQLIRGITSVLDELPRAAGDMLSAGNDSAAAGLYRELFDMIRGDAGAVPDSLAETVPAAGSEAAEMAESVVTGETILQGAAGEAGETTEAGQAGEAAKETGETETTKETGKMETSKEDGGKPEAASREPGRAIGEAISAGNGTEMPGKEAGRPVSGTGISRTMMPELSNLPDSGAAEFAVPERTRAAVADGMLQVLDELQVLPGEKEDLREGIQRFVQGEAGAKELFDTAAKMLNAAGHTEGGIRELHRLFAGKEFQSILTSQIKERWTLRPEEVSRPEKVEELYRRIDRQVKGLLQALETGGQENSTAYRAAANLSQNVDFMNQINQMYAYVQLPLRQMQSEAHGDLYVYANKRSLADNDGKISALLHLDMEHLGPLDVYVTLQEARVSTKFYVADDEILDFIEGHMDILTKRLEKRGYSCSMSMTTRGEKKEQEGGGLAPLLQQEPGMLLSQYAFDVRT